MTEPSQNRALADVFDNLVRCQLRLYNALDDALNVRHGIVVSQFLLLRYLRETAEVRAAEIATHFAIGIGSTSKAIDRHEKMGWLSRIAHPGDRRSFLLELTETGRSLVDEAEQTFDETLSGLLAEHADSHSLTAFAASLQTLRSNLERGAVGQPVG